MSKIIRWFGNLKGLIYTIIVILIVVVGILFVVKFVRHIGNTISYVTNPFDRQDNYETIVETDTFPKEETPDIDISLWERLWKSKSKPYLIQPVKYPDTKYKNLISYLKRDNKYITLHARNIVVDGEQYGDTLVFPTARSFEVISMDDGVHLITHKDYFDWTGLEVEGMYLLTEYNWRWTARTGIQYNPLQMQLGIYAKYPIEAGVYVRKRFSF